MYFASYSIPPPSLLYCLSVSSSLFSFCFTPPSGFSSASWSTPGAAPWGGVVTTACASSSRPGSARRPPGSPADWSRDTNWHRLLRWWKEKAWPADWWKSVRRELSSSGKTQFFYKNLTYIVSYLLTFPRLFGDLTSLSLRFLHRHPQNHLCWYLNVWMCVCACRGVKKKKPCCLICSLSVNRCSVLTLKRHVQLWFAIGTVKATSLTDVNCVKVLIVKIRAAQRLRRYKYLLHWTL